MSMSRMTVVTPWSPLDVVVDAEGVVVASWFDQMPPEGGIDVGDARVVRRIDDVAAAVGDWIDGDADAILRLPVRQPGGAFRQEAWAAMRRIPGGSVVTYGELAVMAGRPRAARAAGTACAVNTVAPFVPCHRVVRTGGSLGQYGYGVDLKEALLRHEHALD